MAYQAFWIPGLDSDFDPDRALELGGRWLRQACYPGRRLIVLHAAKMVGNRRSLWDLSSQYEVVAPQTKNHPGPGGHAVLAVWASERALELAENLAMPGGGLCLIPGTFGAPTRWIERTGAVNLVEPEGTPGSLDLDPAVIDVLDSVLAFDGHNRFHGAGGKERAVRDLREMLGHGRRPSPQDVEAYALQSGETDHEGAAHLRKLYEGILVGKGFRDYRGRPI